jgi:Transport and Golgi organisation 2
MLRRAQPTRVYDGTVCTVVVSFEPGERSPVLLLGIRDELTERPWRPPAAHWPGSPLIGGLDEQAGGTWLAVHPAVPRVSCLLNGRGVAADPAAKRSRGELPLRAAADGAQVLKELAEDDATLARYDPFHLVVADLGSLWLLSWDGERAMNGDVPPGTRVLVNSGHAYPASPVTEPKAAYFGPRFAASRPSGDPALPAARAWEPWLTLAAGDGLDPGDPRAIIARRVLPDGRQWGTTSLSLVALAADGGVRYDFQSLAAGDDRWHRVALA